MGITRILLTGARGMVGRNILEHPRISQWEVLAPSRDELDLSSYSDTRSYLSTWKPNIVVHAAGVVGGIHANMSRPVDFLVNNIDIGRNIIMAARDCEIPQFLNLASSCMYPRNAVNPLTENLILTGELEPTNEGYALAKIFSTRLCQYIVRERPEYSYKTLIPCNLYGRHDKFDPATSHLIPAIIHKLHTAKCTGASEIDIWGAGTARREFMYSGDIADAVVRAIENFDNVPELMNIGLGHDYTINEYYRAAAHAIDWQGDFIHDLSKPVGMMQKLVCTQKQTEWGWQPSTSLTDGILKTYHYYLATLTP